MATKTRVSLLLLCALGIAGCGDGSVGLARQPLERSDVEDIDGGTADGSKFSALYTIASFDTVLCECREGDGVLDCSTVALRAEALQADQTDGALVARVVTSGEVQSGIEYVGGVDEDGWFRLGGVLEATDGDGNPSGVAFELLEGQFEPGGGAFEAQWNSRLQAIVEGESVDCDFVHEIKGIVVE